MKTVPAAMRLALVCAFSFLLCTSSAHATDGCFIDDQVPVTQPMSDLARNIQSLNQQLSGQVTAAGSLARVAPMALPARSMLSSRRDMVVQLMRESPAEVRAVMLSPETAAALTASDPAAAALLEKEATLEGQLTSMVADDFKHHTSTTLYRLHTMTKEIGLFPVSSFNLKHQIHQQISATGIVLDGAMAVETTSQATLSLTGEMSSPLPATTAAADSAPACSTKGDQKIGLIIVKFTGGASYPAGLDQAAYWQNVLFGSNPSVNSYWKEISYNQTSLSGDVLGTITLPTNYGCADYEALRIAALGSARTAFDLSKYNRIMITFPESTCTYGGLGYAGCSSADSYVSHDYSFTWIPVETDYTATYPEMWGNLAHELGHNLGLGHASTIEYRSKADNKNFLLGPIDTDSIVSGTVDGSGSSSSSTFIRGLQSEYGDKYSDMGNGWSDAGPYSAQHRSNMLGWIPASNVRHVTASDTFTLAPAENSSGLRSARVLRDAASGSWLWLEYHQPTGFYTIANVNHFSTTDLTAGIQIHYENGYSGDREYTYLIDASIPGTSSIGSDFLKHTLTAGQSFVDPFSQIKITAGTPTASGIPVSVVYEPACATATVTPEVLSAAGGTGQINITADAACSYSYSANAPWISIPGADANNSATTSGSRTINFSYTANTGTMRRNYVAVGRVSIPVTQSGVSGIAILPVSPVSTFTTPGAAKTLSLIWDNTKGVADNRSASLYFWDYGTSPTCAVRAVFGTSGTRASLSLRSASNGVFGTAIDAGTAGTLTSTACSVDTGASSISVSGNRTTLRISITPTSAWIGARAIFANVNGTTDQGTLNDGTFGMIGDAVSIAAVPITANQGDAVSVNIKGTNTHFSASSVVSVSGSGVTAASTSVTDATTLTTQLTVAAGAATGERILTVTTGAEVVTTPFTVLLSGTSTTLLNVSDVTAVPGAPVTLIATVSGGSGVPTGSVIFKDGAAALSTVALSAGRASLTTTSLSAASHAITAAYSGDSIYRVSTSDAQTVIIAKGYPTTTLGLSANTILSGNSVTLTATVSYPGTIAPTGTVTFKDGSATLATSPLVNGSASYTTTSLADGTHSLTATYSGDSAYNSVISTAQKLTVGKATPTLTLASSTSSAFLGNAVTFTAKISAASGTPSGNITFLAGSANLGSSPISGDTATLILSSLPAGTNSVTASYPGNNELNAVTSPVTSVTVSDFTFNLPSGTLTVTAGAVTGNTATLNFSPASGSLSIPVVLSCSGAPAGASCSINPSPLVLGSSPVTATVTVNTTARPANSGFAALNLLAFPLLGISAIAYRRRLGRAACGLVMLAVLGSVLGFTGCSRGSSGGGGSATPPATGTPAGNSTLTITAVASNGSQSLTRTSTLSLTVR